MDVNWNALPDTMEYLMKVMNINIKLPHLIREDYNLLRSAVNAHAHKGYFSDLHSDRMLWQEAPSPGIRGATPPKNCRCTPWAEMQEYLRVHERQLTSKELTKAHDEYTRRMNKGGVKQFRLLDVDGNGKLDLEECISGSKILGLTEDQAAKWFTDLDKDGSGDVDMEVLNDVIC